MESSKLDSMPVKKASLSDLVVEKIKAAIRSGDLKPGDKLPSHDELCRRWGISLTTIREALNKLESVGVLKKYQGRGTYIQEISTKQIMPKEELGLLLSKTSIMELLEARKLIETAVAGLAAERGTEEQIKTLETLLKEMDNAGAKSNHRLYAQSDNQFHLFLCKMSNNSFLENMMKSIRSFLFTQHMEVIAIKANDQRKIARESQKYHREIFNAIISKNPELARESMYKHLKCVEEFLRRSFV